MYVLRAEICLHNLLVLGFINRCTQASNHIPVQPVERCSHNTPLLRFMSRYTQVLSHNCYACSTCGKMFTQDSDLEKHERIHTGDKLCVCSIVERCSHIITILKGMNVFTQALSRMPVLLVERCSHVIAILKYMNLFTRVLSRMHVLLVDVYTN